MERKPPLQEIFYQGGDGALLRDRVHVRARISAGTVWVMCTADRSIRVQPSPHLWFCPLTVGSLGGILPSPSLLRRFSKAPTRSPGSSIYRHSRWSIVRPLIGFLYSSLALLHEMRRTSVALGFHGMSRGLSLDFCSVA